MLGEESRMLEPWGEARTREEEEGAGVLVGSGEDGSPRFLAWGSSMAGSEGFGGFRPPLCVERSSAQREIEHLGSSSSGS